MNKPLNVAYCKMLSNIKKHIETEHHPNDIKLDDPDLYDHIHDELDCFDSIIDKHCANQNVIEPMIIKQTNTILNDVLTHLMNLDYAIDTITLIEFDDEYQIKMRRPNYDDNDYMAYVRMIGDDDLTNERFEISIKKCDY